MDRFVVMYMTVACGSLLLTAILPFPSRSLRVGVLLPHSTTSRSSAIAQFIMRFASLHDNAVHIVQLPSSEPRTSLQQWSFYNVVRWRNAMATLDLIVGTRIHGSMISIAAKTPTLTIAEDARVKELCKQMRLPMVGLWGPLMAQIPCALPRGLKS